MMYFKTLLFNFCVIVIRPPSNESILKLFFYVDSIKQNCVDYTNFLNTYIQHSKKQSFTAGWNCQQQLNSYMIFLSRLNELIFKMEVNNLKFTCKMAYPEASTRLYGRIILSEWNRLGGRSLPTSSDSSAIL